MVPEPEQTDGAAAFTGALARLRREGSNLLVVGAAAERSHTAVCDRLVGDSGASRHRAFVSTGGGGCGRPAGDATHIRYAASRRSAAAATTADPDPDHIDTLASLGSTVAETIASAGSRADGLDPAQFRLCFDSLGPLLEAHSHRELFRFLHAVTNEVSTVCGMAHYHLPMAYGDETVGTLAPLFDAVIEVRRGPDGPQQRWHLDAVDAPTEWLRL